MWRRVRRSHIVHDFVSTERFKRRFATRNRDTGHKALMPGVNSVTCILAALIVFHVAYRSDKIHR